MSARTAGSVGPGESGELQLRNPVVMRGYLGMPEETAAVLLRDGWLRTGDLVTVNDDGTYTFVSRVKEVIRRRGENLSPLEVEEVLESHPAVQECAVTGVPSELSEEEVKAFLVAADGVAAGLRRAARVRGRAARAVQGAEILAAARRAAPDADRQDREAPAARRTPARGV